jgi:hypothetical protein
MFKDQLNDLLTTDQRIRLGICELFPENPKAAYDFIMADNPSVTQTTQAAATAPIKQEQLTKPGVYLYDSLMGLYYSTDYYGKNKTHLDSIFTIASLAIVGPHGIRFRLALKNEGSMSLYSDISKCPKDDEAYIVNGKVNLMTDYSSGLYLKHGGVKLDYGYVPPTGIWVIIMQYLKTINEALEYVGGECIDNGCYLTATEANDEDAYVVIPGEGDFTRVSKLSPNLLRAIDWF